MGVRIAALAMKRGKSVDFAGSGDLELKKPSFLASGVTAGGRKELADLWS
jgi:hypothetical protein